MKKLFLGCLIFTMISCQKATTSEVLSPVKEDSNLIENLKSTYGITSFNSIPTKEESNKISISINENGKTFNRLKHQIDISTMKLFVNKNEGITIATMRFHSTPEKVYSVKGQFVKGRFILNTELLFGRQLVDKNNAQIRIIKDNEAILVSVKNGIETITSTSGEEAEYNFLQVKDCNGNHGGTGTCQREPGESFATCYKAEKDEMCDGFFSCLAVDLYPPVMILIALACECQATQCPQ